MPHYTVLIKYLNLQNEPSPSVNPSNQHANRRALCLVPQAYANQQRLLTNCAGPKAGPESSDADSYQHRACANCTYHRS